jgi:hypothetical protein
MAKSNLGIVARLRQPWFTHGCAEYQKEAADRIEGLEKALNDIHGAAICVSITGPEDWPDMLQHIYTTAEKALEEHYHG